MEKHYPKFEQRQKRDATNTQLSQLRDREGVIMTYNSFSNTATVLMSMPKSEGFGAILENVPCPTYNGIQTVHPEPGRLAWIVFVDNNERKPRITHFYNMKYDEYDYAAQKSANSMIPNFYSSS